MVHVLKTGLWSLRRIQVSVDVYGSLFLNVDRWPIVEGKIGFVPLSSDPQICILRTAATNKQGQLKVREQGSMLWLFKYFCKKIGNFHSHYSLLCRKSDHNIDPRLLEARERWNTLKVKFSYLGEFSQHMYILIKSIFWTFILWMKS
jgi:hypothetical protein